MSATKYYAPMVVGSWDRIQCDNSSIPVQFDSSFGAGFICVYLTREEALANCPEGAEVLTFVAGEKDRRPVWKCGG